MKLEEQTIAARRSRPRSFFSSKVNTLLVFSVASLTVVLGFVVGFVTAPRFQADDEKDGNGSNGNGTSNSKLSNPDNTARYAVVKENFPDPCLVMDWTSQSAGAWYAFATRNSQVHVQLASSSNMAHWTYHDGYDAMPTPGAWVASTLDDSEIWAPSVTNRVWPSSKNHTP